MFPFMYSHDCATTDLYHAILIAMRLCMVDNDYIAKGVQSLMCNQYPSQLDNDCKFWYKLDLSDDKIASEWLPMTMDFHALSVVSKE